MQLYCPACKTAAHAAERCARCGERLVAPSELASLSRDQLADPPDLAEPTAFGRVFVGVVVALGLYLSLRELALGSLAALDPPDAALGPVATWLLRAVAVLVGALLAGAGRSNGVAAGGVAGLTCAGLLLATDFLSAVKLTNAEFAAAAGVGLASLGMGRLGSTIWPAVVPLPPSKVRSRGSSLLPLKDDEDAPRPVPLAWTRIALGVVVAVGGVLLADDLRVGLRSLAGDGLFLGSPSQAPVVDCFFGCLAVAAGGLIAGGGSGAGLRHGVVMGLIASGCLAFLVLLGKESAILPLTGLLELVGSAADSPRTASGLTIVVGGLMTLSLVSSGFGGLLLPRLAVPSRRKAYSD